MMWGGESLTEQRPARHLRELARFLVFLLTGRLG